MYSVQLFCLKEVIVPAFTGMKHTFSSPQPPQLAGKPLAEVPTSFSTTLPSQKLVLPSFWNTPHNALTSVDA